MSKLTTMLGVLRWAPLFAIVGLTGIVKAEDIDNRSQLLATAITNVRGTLEDGLKASERIGKPISAKFGVQHGVVYLCISIAKNDGFSEVILYPTIRMITEVVEVTDVATLKIAEEQKLVMGRVSMSLLSATANALKAHDGFRAVSVFPILEEGNPIAVVTLLKNGEFKIVTEELN